MLALSLTFLAAAFVLGPDLLFRWVLGFVVPRRSISQNRGEEVTRAILWAVLPLALSIEWVRSRHILSPMGGWNDVQTVVSGLYSNAYFDGHTQQIFVSFVRVAQMTGSLLLRLYLIVFVFAVALDLLIVKYRWLRSALKPKWAQTALATLVLPRVSEWHVLLSDMLLPNEDATLVVDVLTRSGTLYTGRFQDKVLGTDGSLQTITLADPRRFLRDEFHRAKEEDPKVNREGFWRPIEGKLFVLFGADLASVNVRYRLRQNMAAGLTPHQLNPEETKALRGLLSKLVDQAELKRGSIERVSS